MSHLSGYQWIALCICLLVAACIAGCTDRAAPDTSGKIATPAVTGITTMGIPQTADCSNILTSGPKALAWISEVPTNSPGAGLLSGAKALMKGIYVYSSDSPDYLPTSYTNQKSSATAYVVHAANPSNVSWAPSGENQVVWKSSPGGFPKGWSGTVTMAGPAATNVKPESLHVLTDCSGFITSLFAYANTEHSTKFTGWKTGSIIPEAGCFNPQGGCNEPAPLSYYNLFTTGQGGFRSVLLEDLQPGDMIAYANTKNRDDSGHIMLVAAVSSCTGDPKSRFVVVIDETGSPHSFDTRPVKVLLSGEKSGAGAGMGIAKLSYSPQNTLEFYWGLNSTAPQIGSIALGRAL